jgi:hypothetical protein
MKTKAINHILKAIKNKADAISYDIDSHPDYRKVCQIVTDFEHDGTVPTLDQKQYCADILDLLCAGLSLNYHSLLDEAIQKCYA